MKKLLVFAFVLQVTCLFATPTPVGEAPPLPATSLTTATLDLPTATSMANANEEGHLGWLLAGSSAVLISASGLCLAIIGNFMFGKGKDLADLWAVKWKVLPVLSLLTFIGAGLTFWIGKHLPVSVQDSSAKSVIVSAQRNLVLCYFSLLLINAFIYSIVAKTIYLQWDNPTDNLLEVCKKLLERESIILLIASLSLTSHIFSLPFLIIFCLKPLLVIDSKPVQSASEEERVPPRVGEQPVQ